MLVTELTGSSPLSPLGLKVAAALQSITLVLKTGKQEEADDMLLPCLSSNQEGSSSPDTFSAAGNIAHTN